MVREVVGKESDVCPVCGSRNLDWDGDETFYGSINFYFTCGDCGSKGTESYKLVFDSITAEVEE